MKRFTSRAALVVAVWAGLLGACNKKKDKGAEWEQLGRSPAVEKNRAAATSIKAPPMLAHVPADTPYVFAMLQPIPQAYWSRTCDALCPPLEQLLASGTALPGQRRGDRLIRAIAGEIAGKLSKDGLASLGLSTDMRMVIYGLGTLPVMRAELADPNAFAATVARIEANSGTKFPQRTLTNQPSATPFYYTSGSGEALAIGVVGKELVATFGRTGAVEAELPVLFGGQPMPGPTMADGAALKKIAADHGFAGYGVGYVDFHQLIEASLPTPMPVAAPAGAPAAAAGAPAADPQATCRAALERGAAVFPRVVFGYDEISAKRAWMSGVLEADPDTAAALKAAQLSVPGVTSRMPQGALLVIGGAADRGKLAPLYHRAMAWANQASAACGGGALGDLQDGFANLGLAGGFDLDDVRGGVLALMSIDLAGGMPQSAGGFAIIGVNDAGTFLQSLGMLLGDAAGKVEPDGKFHTVDLGPVSSFVKSPLKIAGKDGAVVVAAGDKARATAEAATRGPASPSPFFLLAYDVGKLQSLMGSLMQASPELAAFNKAYEKLFGPAIFTLQPQARGLGITARIDLR